MTTLTLLVAFVSVSLLFFLLVAAIAAGSLYAGYRMGREGQTIIHAHEHHHHACGFDEEEGDDDPFDPDAWKRSSN